MNRFPSTPQQPPAGGFFEQLIGRTPQGGTTGGLLGALQQLDNKPQALFGNLDSSFGGGGNSFSNSSSSSYGRELANRGKKVFRTVPIAQVFANREFKRRVEQAWEDSNPYREWTERREVGFWAVITFSKNGNVADIDVKLSKFGKNFSYDEKGKPIYTNLQLGRKPHVDENTQAVIMFHTHPFRTSDGMDSRPSDADKDMPKGVLGIIKRDSGLCVINTGQGCS